MYTGAFGILRIPEWILKFAYLSLLWIVFSVCGLIAFGVFPSTVALFSISRKWIKGEIDVPVFRNFLHFYKKGFIKSNLLGLATVIFGITLYIYFQLIQELNGILFTISFYLLMTILFLYIMTALYAVAVYVHFDSKLKEIIKNAFLIMIASPLHSLMIISGSVILFLVFRSSPGLMIIFGPSVFSFLVMFSAYLAFAHLGRRRDSQRSP